MKQPPKNLWNTLRSKPRSVDKQYRQLKYSDVEKALAEFYNKIPDTDDQEVVDLTAIRRTAEQAEKIMLQEDSIYHRILDGYMYGVFTSGSVYTGSGGARMLFKAMLMQGMSEEMIGSVMYVTINDEGDSYPLNDLIITKKNGEEGTI